MSTPAATVREPRKAALTFIFVTVALDTFAMGMIAPVLPRLITDFEAGNAVKAAEMVGLFGTVWAIMQFAFSPVLGSLSDHYGRRPVILLSNLGLGLDYVVMATAPNIGWLFVGRIISGITAASIPTAMAYIADVTPKEKRAAGFGIIGAAFGLGFVLGPALGGVLGVINPRLPFWVAGGFSLLNFLYGTFVLPESLALQHRAAFSWRRANPVGSLKLLRSHHSLLWLAAIIFLGYVAHQVLNNVYVLYAMNRYGWNQRTIGFSLATVGVCSGLVGAVLVKHVVAKFGDRASMLAGIILGTIGFASFGLAPTGMLFWAAIPFISLWGLAGPSAQSLMSHQVSVSEQGQLQGAVNSLRGIAGMIGPALFTTVYAAAIRSSAIWHDPGAPFYVAAFALLVSFGMALVAARSARQAAQA